MKKKKEIYKGITIYYDKIKKGYKIKGTKFNYTNVVSSIEEWKDMIDSEIIPLDRHVPK